MERYKYVVLGVFVLSVNVSELILLDRNSCEVDSKMLENILNALRKRKPAQIQECKVCNHMIMPYDDTPYYPPMSIRELYKETYNVVEIDECVMCKDKIKGD